MFPTFISIGMYVYYIAVLGYKNKTAIITAYSLIDTTKFIFYVSEKAGIIEAIKKRITYNTPTILLDMSNIEQTDLGDFTIIEN